jgi:hypothetical protein
VIRECTGLRFVTWRAYIVCKKVINKHTRVLLRVVPTGVYYQQQVKCITCDEYHSRVNTSVYLKIPKLKTPLLCKMQHSSIYHSSCSVQICTTHPPPFYLNPHLNKHGQNRRKGNTHTHTNVTRRTRRIARGSRLTRRRPRHHYRRCRIPTRARHAARRHHD